MQERYIRNLGPLTEEECLLLRQRRVFLAGCGGLGGYLLEHLLRAGVGAITVCDGDTIVPSNLNRQLLADMESLGRSKTEAACARAALVNPEAAVEARPVFLTADNALGLIAGHDLALDALDSPAARRILAGSDDPAQQRQYHNDDLGMPWSPVELQTDVDRLLELRDPHLPPRTVPHGAVALTCGIDVQKRGFWYLVRAWMPTMASYVIDYGYLGSWDDVQALVFDTYYPVQGPDGSDVGERMPIWRACIDSGGTETEGVYTRTEEVYMWVRANGCGVVHACKGASRPQAAPVRWVVRERMPHNGRPIPGGLRLYLIDSGAFKTTDMGRMLNQDSRQPLRFHAGADETLASQLSAERMVRKNGNLVWVRERKDNHLLDCLVLSAAAADASWTPSLPHYILQLQAQARMQNETPRPRAKKRPQPEAAGHRW